MSNTSWRKFFPLPNFLSPLGVGLDISDRSIKYVDLVEENGFFSLRRFGEYDLPAGIIEGGEIKQADEFEKILLKLKGQWNLEQVFIALPDDHSYLFDLKLPNISSEEIWDSVELQLEEYVPLPATEVVFDYDLIRNDKQGDYVTLVGVTVFPRNLVLAYQAIFALVGINLLSVEGQGNALARSLVPANSCQNLILVDLGRSHTAIYQINCGVVVHGAVASIGGEILTSSLQKALKLNFAQAEKLKLSTGLSRAEKDKAVFEAIIPAVSAIRDEVEKRVSYWLGQTNNLTTPVDRIILTGGQASLPGLAEYFSSHLNCPVDLANPWEKISPLKNKLSNLPLRQALRYSACLGLSLRNVTFD